ncbi:hypothetical protein [Cupriavidus basilensis]
MISKLAAFSMFLIVGLVSGCGGGGGGTEVATNSSGTGGSSTTPPTPVATPVTTPSTPSTPQTELQTTKALLKSAATAGAAPKTMASPPIITPGTANMPSNIAGSTLVLPGNTAALRYIGAVVQAGPLYPDADLVKNTAVNYGGWDWIPTSITSNSSPMRRRSRFW